MDSLSEFPSLASETWPALSLYLPTPLVTMKKGIEAASRLRHQLHEADSRLEALGFRAPDRRALLAPALKLLEDPFFWEHQEPGLALFLAPGLFHLVRMKVPPPEMVTVGRHFHVRPLLTPQNEENRFWLFAINAKQARLWRCTGNRRNAVDVPHLPRGVTEFVDQTDFQAGRQYNPIARPRRQGSPDVVKSHGLETAEELRKAELIDYLHRVEAAVLPVLNAELIPLVLAAEPEILGHFREFCRYSHIHPDSLMTNPFILREQELRDRAYALLRASFATPIFELRDLILARLGNGLPTATLELRDIVAWSPFSRISGLLIAESARAWGRFDPANDEVVMHDEPAPDDEDLANFAALMSLANGAPVYILPQSEMPRQAIAAAALRY